MTNISIFIILVLLCIMIAVILLTANYHKHPSKEKLRLKSNLCSASEFKHEELYELNAHIERQERNVRIIRNVLIYAFLTIIAFYILLPFYWMFNTSLKTFDEAKLAGLWPGHNPILKTYTFKPQFINFVKAFANERGEFPFGRQILNTLIVGLFSTLGTIVTTVLSAFAFARLNFKGRDLLFTIFLATMMIPGEMLVITNYITVIKFGWYSPVGGGFEELGYLAMIIPFWVSTYYIYLLRQTFKQIPNELYYAAKVDGTNDFQYLMKVMIPIGLPTIITISILKMMGAWNSYIWPNLVTDSAKMRLITNGLRNAFSDPISGQVETNVQMAATVVVTVPLLLVFVFLRKYIMRGVSRSGIKG